MEALLNLQLAYCYLAQEDHVSTFDSLLDAIFCQGGICEFAETIEIRDEARKLFYDLPCQMPHLSPPSAVENSQCALQPTLPVNIQAEAGSPSDQTTSSTSIFRDDHQASDKDSGSLDSRNHSSLEMPWHSITGLTPEPENQPPPRKRKRTFRELDSSTEVADVDLKPVILDSPLKYDGLEEDESQFEDLEPEMLIKLEEDIKPVLSFISHNEVGHSEAIPARVHDSMELDDQEAENIATVDTRVDPEEDTEWRC